MEDLNHLLSLEQIELMKAAASRGVSGRAVHMDRALGYAGRIAAHRLPYRSVKACGGVAFRSPSFPSIQQEACL